MQKAKWREISLLFLLAPLLLFLLLLALPLYFIWTAFLHLAIWLRWCSHGRDILFVYSDSPLWHDYIEAHILPHIHDRAVVLNWSDHKRWQFSLTRLAFYHFGGTREFNPMAVVFRPFRRTRTFRFWQPFQDQKHGRPQSLAEIESEFFSSIGIPGSRRSD